MELRIDSLYFLKLTNSNFLLRVTAEVDQMKMFGSVADDDGKMPLMITSQDEKSGTSECEEIYFLKLLNLKYLTNILENTKYPLILG